MSVNNRIKNLQTKDLILIVNRFRKEKDNPAVYGRHGSSRWVPETEFWQGYRTKIRAELARRQKLGIISKRAGKPRRRFTSPFGFHTPFGLRF